MQKDAASASANEQRNAALGQVWTPDEVAHSMVEMCRRLKPDMTHVLDPACGPGTFSRALHEAELTSLQVTCYDIDPRMQRATKQVHKQLGILGKVSTTDYLSLAADASGFDLVIMNPPYIRHETIDTEKKGGYHAFLSRALEVRVDKRANLFALFLLKGLIDVRPGGLLCAIVYDAINHSAYGRQVSAVLHRHAQLREQKHVKTPFNGVLVDAQILIYEKRDRVLDESDAGESGTGFIENQRPGWTRLENLLEVRRGTALPLRRLCIAEPSDPFYALAKPMLIKQASLPGLYAQADQRVYLPNEPGIRKADKDQLLQWLAKRSQALGREPGRLTVSAVRGTILFNYYIRNAPRHLWNGARLAVADNFYAAEPAGDFNAKAAWLLLNSTVYLQSIEGAARNQGNGLSKLQLYEYRNVSVPDWRTLAAGSQEALERKADQLIKTKASLATVRQAVDDMIKDVFA